MRTSIRFTSSAFPRGYLQSKCSIPNSQRDFFFGPPAVLPTALARYTLFTEMDGRRYTAEFGGRFWGEKLRLTLRRMLETAVGDGS